MTLTQDIFLCAMLWVSWTYIGYPLAIFCVAWLRPKFHQREDGFKSSVSVVIAAHNERPSIINRIREFRELIKNSRLIGEIIVVSDGSSDGTETLPCETDNGEIDVKMIALRENIGKAAAISIGCANAKHDVIVLADARQNWANDALARLIENFADPQVGGVSGDLVLETSPGVQAGVGLYWKYEKWIRNNEAIAASTVGVSGSICAVRRELFSPIPAGIILDDVYWPMKVARRGFRIVHDPSAKAFDRLPSNAQDEFRRKVRTLAGNFQLVAREPSLLLPWRNPIWVQFISHKLMRLAVPWAMLVMLICCALNHTLGGNVLLVAQMAFYGIGLIAMIGGTRVEFHFATPIASFLLLNAAAWMAFWVWITGRAGRSWNKTLYQPVA